MRALNGKADANAALTRISRKPLEGVQISFDAANDGLSIILNSSVPVSIGARCRRCSQRQAKMLLEPSDSWAEGVAVSI